MQKPKGWILNSIPSPVMLRNGWWMKICIAVLEQSYECSGACRHKPSRTTPLASAGSGPCKLTKGMSNHLCFQRVSWSELWNKGALYSGRFSSFLSPSTPPSFPGVRMHQLGSSTRRARAFCSSKSIFSCCHNWQHCSYFSSVMSARSAISHLLSPEP